MSDESVAAEASEWADGADDGVRSRLALALDTDDLVEAERLAGLLRPWFGVAKVGLELFAAGGPEAIGVLRELGMEVFVDLKLHDIPSVVYRGARVLGSLGARYLTLHARGDLDMLRAGVEGLAEGAENAGLPRPIALAVTVLTSDDSAPPHIVPNRVRVALEGGCSGLVLAADDLEIARQLAPRLVRVVAGIRPAGAPADDQVRAATPEFAISEGADLLVLGRPVIGADDPTAVAARLAASVAGAMRR